MIGVALAHCILGKFLGVVCHCFPPPLDVPTFAARCLYVRNDARDPSSERWNCGPYYFVGFLRIGSLEVVLRYFGEALLWYPKTGQDKLLVACCVCPVRALATLTGTSRSTVTAVCFKTDHLLCRHSRVIDITSNKPSINFISAPKHAIWSRSKLKRITQCKVVSLANPVWTINP